MTAPRALNDTKGSKLAKLFRLASGCSTEFFREDWITEVDSTHKEENEFLGKSWDTAKKNFYLLTDFNSFWPLLRNISKAVHLSTVIGNRSRHIMYTSDSIHMVRRWHIIQNDLLHWLHLRILGLLGEKYVYVVYITIPCCMGLGQQFSTNAKLESTIACNCDSSTFNEMYWERKYVKALAVLEVWESVSRFPGILFGIVQHRLELSRNFARLGKLFKQSSWHERLFRVTCSARFKGKIKN